MHLEANLNYFFTTFIKRFWLVLLHITKFYMSGQTDVYCACIDSKNIFFQEYNAWCMTRSFLAWILRWQSLTDIKIDSFLITISNWHFYMLILHKDGNEKMMSIWNYTSLFQKMYTFTHFCNFCLKILWFVLNTYNRIIVYGKEKAKTTAIRR